MILAGAVVQVSAQKKFSFFAIGDMPYHNPGDIEKFKKLTRAINAEKPAFTVHVGDIKNGASVCSDEYFASIQNLFKEFKKPLVYTPGDNEWTDCDRPAAGGYDPIERLAAVRRLYFQNDESMGQKPLRFISQRKTPGFEDFVENVIWRKGGITFAALHVVGSNNNLKALPEVNEEFLKRDKANIHWLTEIFRSAKENKDAGIVVIMHAAMVYQKSETNGFNNIVEKLRTELQSFDRPVLLIYGDQHRFMVSKPLFDSQNRLIRNFTALMVFGDNDMNAVRINVNAKSKEVFSFSEFVMEY